LPPPNYLRRNRPRSSAASWANESCLPRVTIRA